MDNFASTSSTKPSKTPSTETTKTAVSTSIRTVLSENTSIFFKQYGSQFAKLRLSLLNVSNSILHFKFKKSSGTKLVIEPQASGIIGKRSETFITLTWDISAHESVTPDGWHYVKMVLFLAIDGKFEDLDNCSLTRVVGYLPTNPRKFDENAEADVLVVDVPNKANSIRQQLSRREPSPARKTSTSRQTIVPRQASRANTLKSTTSVRTVSSELRHLERTLSKLELLERQQFSRWLLLYFLLIILAGLLFYIYRVETGQIMVRN
uniref:Major sperm protein n=1 Tax=Meloidogyne hapla TaxID=6305 RepID=A0A1I8BDX7_MELHA